MKKQHIVIALAAATLAACGSSSPIGTVDVGRVIANWPEYQNDQMQLLADEQRVANSKESNSAKQRDAGEMQAKYAKITEQLTEQIKTAAQKVASDKQLKLVVTREGVGYGGTDITPDVEKAMNITEKPTSSPSP